MIGDAACCIEWANTLIRNAYRTNVPAVGRQHKNLIAYWTNVPAVGGQQKN